MAFGSSLQENRPETTGNADPIYLKLQDERLVRVLDQQETVYWRYFMNVKVGDRYDGRPVIVGRENVIRPYMERIGKEDRNWRALQQRKLLNVLDRTEVKKTSSGVAVYPNSRGVFPDKDPASGEDLRDSPVVPNNKVMVIDFGNALMRLLMAYHGRVRHMKDFRPLNIWEFDVRIVSTLTDPKDAKSVERIVMPDQNQEPLPEELANLPKYDLSQLCRPMPVEMQERLLDGADYLEIIRELGWERPTPTVRQ
jgi:hypothetical protein